MAVGDAHVFPGFLTPLLTQLFLSKATDYFSHMLLYAGKKVRLNRESKSQPQDHDSDTLTTEPSEWGAQSM